MAVMQVDDIQNTAGTSGPQFSRGIVGNTSLTSLPGTGLVGEVIQVAHSSGIVTTSVGGTGVLVDSITLTAGVWLVVGTYWVVLNSVLSNRDPYTEISLRDNGNTTTYTRATLNTTLTASSIDASSTCVFVYPVAINASTTYKVYVQCSLSNTDATASVYNDGGSISGGTKAVSVIRAIRIA